MYRGILVDDVKTDRQRYEKKLSIPNKLCVSAIPFSGKPTIRKILKEKPEIVFLDQELVEGKPDDVAEPQFGSTVAALVREELPETPIVLVTRGSIFRTEVMSASRDVPRAFDDVLIKSFVARNLGSIRGDLLVLLSGFEELQACTNRTLEGLWQLLRSVPDEVELLRRADPPRSTIGPDHWRVSEAAHWIRRIVLRYPGIVYDALYSASFLGMSVESFMSSDIQHHFADARYEGTFAPTEGRWWRGRLQRIAFDFFQQRNASASAAHEFTKVWNETPAVHLAESECLVDGTVPAETVCFVYKQPVSRKNSLPYWPDNRPSVMDEARVSFKAVRESNDFEEAAVATDARSLVPELQRRD